MASNIKPGILVSEIFEKEPDHTSPGAPLRRKGRLHAVPAWEERCVLSVWTENCNHNSQGSEDRLEQFDLEAGCPSRSHQGAHGGANQVLAP